MAPIPQPSTLLRLISLRTRTIQTLDSLLSYHNNQHSAAKRQQDSGNTNTNNDIIPTHYPSNGRNAGAVVGITLGSVAGFLLLCILIYFLRGGRANGPGPQVTGTEDIVIPARRAGGAHSHKPARSHRSRSKERERERDAAAGGAARSHRKSHRRSERSIREMREISRSPPARRPSRTIVEERVERVSPRAPASRPSRSQIIVDERFDERRRGNSRPPSIRRVDGDDIVEVIEEGSIDEPPRRSRQRRSSQGYRLVELRSLPGGGSVRLVSRVPSWESSGTGCGSGDESLLARPAALAQQRGRVRVPGCLGVRKRRQVRIVVA